MLMFFSAFMAISAAGPQAAKALEQDPIICTKPSVEHSVGTRMRPRKVCKRKSEWDGVDQRSQRQPNQQRTDTPAVSDSGGRQ